MLRLLRLALLLRATSSVHLIQMLIDDYGWFNAGWHTPGNPEVQTPRMDALVREGVELDRMYAFKYCSPSRCALQSGRNPLQVNVLNDDGPEHNKADPVGGWMGLARNFTGVATKLRAAGFHTHQVGKWDVGMGTEDHTPRGRGYNSSLIYFMHENDYWSDTSYYTCGAETIVDLWAHNATSEGGARTLNQSAACSQAAQAGCAYVDDIFLAQVLSIIAAHDPATPLFLSWMPHGVHSPLEVPDAYLEKFAFIADPRRRAYAAMVNHVDDMVGRVADALKAKGMWGDLLWLTSSDNGGPIYNNGSAGANNFPLRGGKGANWEGGIRASAWASGGLLPAAQRGTKVSGLMSLSDVFATFCALAHVDPTDERAARAGLPPIDSFDLWPLLSGANGTSPRAELALGSAGLTAPWLSAAAVQGLIQMPWKLLIGDLGQDAWTSPVYPNATTSWPDTPHSCGAGCLFNLVDDPTEHEDLESARPDVVARMRARVAELQAAVYDPDRGSDDGAACAAAMDRWGGFWGPFEP